MILSVNSELLSTGLVYWLTRNLNVCITELAQHMQSKIFVTTRPFIGCSRQNSIKNTAFVNISGDDKT